MIYFKNWLVSFTILAVDFRPLVLFSFFAFDWVIMARDVYVNCAINAVYTNLFSIFCWTRVRIFWLKVQLANISWVMNEDNSFFNVSISFLFLFFKYFSSQNRLIFFSSSLNKSGCCFRSASQLIYYIICLLFFFWDKAKIVFFLDEGKIKINYDANNSSIRNINWMFLFFLFAYLSISIYIHNHAK